SGLEHHCRRFGSAEGVADISEAKVACLVAAIVDVKESCFEGREALEAPEGVGDLDGDFGFGSAGGGEVFEGVGAMHRELFRRLSTEDGVTVEDSELDGVPGTALTGHG